MSQFLEEFCKYAYLGHCLELIDSIFHNLPKALALHLLELQFLESPLESLPPLHSHIRYMIQKIKIVTLHYINVNKFLLLTLFSISSVFGFIVACVP